MMPYVLPTWSTDKTSYNQLKASTVEMAAEIYGKYDSVLERIQKLEERWFCSYPGSHRAFNSCFNMRCTLVWQDGLRIWYITDRVDGRREDVL